MSGVQNQRVQLGQAKGPEVELMVSGTQQYATYETLDGYPAIYDDAAGLYCYAVVTAGRYRTTGVSIATPVPQGVVRHAKESDAVRGAKIEEAFRRQR
jgi:hypothetical protein